MFINKTYLNAKNGEKKATVRFCNNNHLAGRFSNNNLPNISSKSTYRPSKKCDIFFSNFRLILGYIGLLYFVMWITDKVKSYIDQINKNTKEIQNIKEEMSIHKHFTEIEKRISLLEMLRKNKKGRLAIDPKWIFLAILLILFYLYLRSIGIV